MSKNLGQRKEFGATWWGMAWLRALDGIDDQNRLPRGRSYARAGMVAGLEFDDHLIEGRVCGSRPKPYKVSVGVRRFSNYQTSDLIRTIIRETHLLAALFSGQVPADLEPLCRELGLPLFPDTWKDLSMQCSCPDWAVPCKHIAAVLYLVAREIDRDPLLVFRLHGVDLMGELRERGVVDHQQQLIDIPSVDDLLCAAQEETTLLSVHPEDPDFQALPRPVLRLLECLAPSPGFYPAGDFRQHLIRYLLRAMKTLDDVSDDPFKSADGALDLRRVEYAELIIGDDFQVEACWWYLTDGEDLEVLDFTEVIKGLLTLPDRHLSHLSDDVRLLVHTARLARHMIAVGMVWPKLFELRSSHWILLWWPVEWVSEWASILQSGEGMVREGVITVLRNGNVESVRKNGRFSLLLSLFISQMMRSTSANSSEKIGIHLAEKLFFQGEGLQEARFEDRGLAGAIHLWLGRIRPSSEIFRPVVALRVSEGDVFLGCVMVRDGQGSHAPLLALQTFLQEDQYAPHRLGLLKSLDFLGQHSAWLRQAIRDQWEVTIKEEALWPFFNDTLPVLNWLGIPIFLPEVLKGLVKPVVGFRAELLTNDGPAPGLLKLDELLAFNWQIALGERRVSLEDFERLYQRGSSVIRINDDYVIVDPGGMTALLDRIRQRTQPSGMDLLRHVLADDYDGGPVDLSDHLREELRKRFTIPEVPVPTGLQATLRPYQERGFRWLYRNIRLVSGAIIADDMGLGKTIQVIALMITLKEQQKDAPMRILVVAPATLLGNWQREIDRFAPGISVNIYHGAGRREPFQADVTLTTYGMLRTKSGAILKQEWDLAVLDEAQAIKNAEVKQTKAVKTLKAKARIAMTGTPVENRLSDYWSIFDFTLPGYLGCEQWFKEYFGQPIQQLHDREKLERFRRIVDPFILRRMKTDRTIVPDLPDKLEANQYCDLTLEQAALYQARTDTLNQILLMEDKFKRGGMLFKLLIHLKQICNHPAQFEKDGLTDPLRSGKAIRVLELVDEFIEAGEQCLLFTQFIEMATLLERMLYAERGIRSLMINGSIPRAHRDEAVKKFQSGRYHPVMIVTIKAGGSGLNLTAASQVIHYDLWWNPAVEAQATDRAYRIGQEKRVMVHRLICKNTLEKKIDRLIQAKKHLAELTVSQGEQWIGDLSAEEIRAIVHLEK